MRFIINRAMPLFFLFVLLFPFTVQAENKAVEIEPQKRAHSPQLAAGIASESENSKLPYGRRFPAACCGELQIKGDMAEVTLVEGKAEVIKKGMIKAQPLALGDYAAHGDRIGTKKGSRIELKLPDNSLIRFDEFTTFEIVCVEFDKKTKQRNINVSMVLGKTWANVSKIFGLRGRFAVSTKTAVAGVRGTIYRVNVEEDNSVLVKVYWGEVGVSSAPKPDTASQSQQIMKPTKVLGPHPVAGPHPVSMEEWTYIVKSMQQIFIRPDGTPTKPMPFLAIEDINDWVRWNQERDKVSGGQ